MFLFCLSLNNKLYARDDDDGIEDIDDDEGISDVSTKDTIINPSNGNHK